MEILEDTWFSGVFGHPVFKIRADAGPAHAAQIPALVRRHAAEQPAAMYYAKVDTDDVELVRQLSAAGLYVVEGNMTLGIDTRERQHVACPRVTSACAVAEIRSEQHEPVLAIAGSAFEYTRFHLDPLVADSVAHRIKYEWIRNYVRKQRGVALLVAAAGDRTMGFLAVLASTQDGKRVHVIDLLGVARDGRRRGVASALVADFITRYRGCTDSLQVGTQSANLPSLRLYQNFGFSIIKTAYVMHLHVRDGRPVSGLPGR